MKPKTLFAGLGLLALAGCAVGPDFQRPAAPAVSANASQPMAPVIGADGDGGMPQRFDADFQIPRQWWTLFQSPVLNDLIELALKNSPDLQASEAALRVAQENVLAQQGSFFPSVTASVTPTRQMVAGSVATSASSGATLYNLHTAQLNVGYAPDVFGGVRRAVESLQAQADSQRFQLEAAQLSLSANLVVAVVQQASLQAQLQATQGIVQLEQEQLDLMQGQLRAGAIPEAGVVAQQAVLAQARAGLPPLQRQLAQQHDLIAALVGKMPTELQGGSISLGGLHLPQTLPLSLPSQLVEQRPDVRAAEEQLHAASAQIGVAQANRLPQLSLSAAGGSASTQIGRLFGAGNSFWSLAANLTQPLIDGNALKHRQRAAKAAYDQAAAQYRSTVLLAFQNVADALQALQFDADALHEAQAAERASASSLEIARRQESLGDISRLTLLSAEQLFHQARINLVQAQASRYSDTAALLQALGGGWWHDRPAASAR